MRRIKTYVLMVGVALSVTPIFHYSHAQQSGNNTQILLDVQALKQEIAELRDMVERQNYQMKRLQRQLDESLQSNSVSHQGQVNGAYNSPNSSYAQQPNSYSQPIANSQGAIGVAEQSMQNRSAFEQSERGVPSSIASSADTAASVVSTVQQGELSQPYATAEVAGQKQDTTGLYQPYPNTQGVGTNSQSSVDSVAQQGGTYPPVVDRSFNTSKPDVPVTGEGAQIATNSQLEAGRSGQNNWRTSQPLGEPSDSQQVRTAPQQGLPSQQFSYDQNQALQATTQSAGGVVSVPPLAVTGASNQAINAVQAPVTVGAEASNTAPQSQTFNQALAVDNAQAVEETQAVDSTQAVNSAPVAVKPESDFYSEGINLLKQSQYEQAAVIFEQQLQAHPRGTLADGAHYWIAEAMFLNRKLDVAKSHLKTIISDYPQSSRVPNAMLKTAYIEQGQGNQIEARMLFQEIVTMYPQSDAAIAAKNQLASDS